MRVPRVVRVPGGEFAMGSPDGRPDERPVHVVSVRGFEMAACPVTNAEYALGVAAHAVPEPPWWREAASSAPDQPVVGVSWVEACAYASWLTQRTGRSWRLPSEAEWERAMRGGAEQARTAWGDTIPAGEIPEGPLEGPWPVGRGTPNGFGLCDPGTVVHEWCLDWYDADYYAASPRVAPTGPDEGERRASRGGSWRHRVRWSPPSARSSLPPGFRYADYGFRLVREA